MLTDALLKSIRLIAFDFDGVFTNNEVLVNQDGVESVVCSRSDGLGLERVQSIGVEVIIISTETNSVVGVRANKLGIKCRSAVKNKGDEVSFICCQLGINLKEVMFVGNDINDIAAFRLVGVPVGVADSHEEINSYIIYKTKKNGGKGAVRELCDLVYRAQK
jgi:3-deoxy-D-manno-octulosonate 8-phosphate phosphatase (KDO 8-P phosphatase)